MHSSGLSAVQQGSKSRDSSAHGVQSAGDPRYLCTAPSVRNGKGAVGVINGERIMSVLIWDFKSGPSLGI